MSQDNTQTVRALTADELRERVLHQMRVSAKYWARQPGMSAQEKCDGVAYSILSILEGSTEDIPAFDIVARPHPNDKAYCIREGENYIEDGTIINENQPLHGQYTK